MKFLTGAGEFVIWTVSDDWVITINLTVSGFPVSVTWSVKVHVALIVNAYVVVPSIILTLLGSRVDASYPPATAWALYVPVTSSILPLPFVMLLSVLP